MSSWDDDKTTADDPDNPAATEQLSAEEWNNHVADQKSRVLYGPLADRPNAGDVPNGTTYLITDLANDGGVLTKVVSGAWQIMQIGDASNRPDMFGDVIDANVVETEKLNADWIEDAANYDTLQAAVDAAEAANKSFVAVPPGTYTQTSTLELPNGVILSGVGESDDNPRVEIVGATDVDPVVSVRGDEAFGAGIERVRVSPDDAEDAWNGDITQSSIWRCNFTGDVVISSDGTNGSLGGRFINNNMQGNNITADSGVDSSFLIDQNVRTGTITSNNATEGTNT